MDAIQSATNLVTVNLQGNSITDITGLEGLVNLQWVSLAGNTIAVRTARCIVLRLMLLFMT